MKGASEFLALMLLIIGLAGIIMVGQSTSLFGSGATAEASLQLSVYALDNALDAGRLYLDTALRFSVYQAAFDIGRNGGYQAVPADRGRVVSGRTVAVWWEDGTGLPSDNDLSGRLNGAILASLNVYAKEQITVLDDFRVALPPYTAVDAQESTEGLHVTAMPERQLAITEVKPSGETIVVRKDASLDERFAIPLFAFFENGRLIAENLGRGSDEVIQEEVGREEWIREAAGAQQDCAGVFASETGKNTEAAAAELKERLGAAIRAGVLTVQIDQAAATPATGTPVITFPYDGALAELNADIIATGSPSVGCRYTYQVTAVLTATVREAVQTAYPVFNGKETTREPIALAFAVVRNYRSDGEALPELDVPVSTGSFGDVRPLDETGYRDLIEQAGLTYGVPAELIAAIIQAESSWDADALSCAGAAGLIQLVPSTARSYGLTVPPYEMTAIECDGKTWENVPVCNKKTPEKCDRAADKRFDPQKNIDAGARFLGQLLDWFGEDELQDLDLAQCEVNGRIRTEAIAEFAEGLRYAIAAYNGGVCGNVESSSCHGTVRWECEQNPGWEETRDYVPKVENFYAQYRQREAGAESVA